VPESVILLGPSFVKGKVGVSACAGNSLGYMYIKFEVETRCRWLMPVVLATWESEVRRIQSRGQPRQIVWETPSPK
jgi:hypothetical protein